MKFARLIVFILLLPIYSHAQNGVYFIPSDKQADSMRNILANTTNDTLKMCAYYYLSSYYTELNKDSSLYFGELQLQSAKNLKQPLWAADALFQIAYLTDGLGNYPVSLNSVAEGLSITEDETSEKNNWRVSLFSEDGNAYRAHMFISSALHQIFAFLYDNVGNTSKAISEYNTAIKTAQSVDNKEELSLDYMSLAGEYMGEKPDSALAIENKALNYAIQSNYKIYLGTILDIIGDIYLDKNNYDSSAKYFQDAIPASIEQNNLKDEIEAYLSMAMLKRKTGETDSALVYARKALHTSQQFGLASGKERAYNALFSAYKLMGNKDSAYAYLQLAKSLDDSLNEAQRIKTNQYQSLSLNDEISLREKEKAKIEAENKIRVYALLTGIAALLLIAFLLFRNNRTRKRANALLQEQKEQIEQQKEKVENTLSELKSTQAQLIQSEKMASLGQLTSGIAHEIQNPLNFVNNFSEVSTELVDEMNIELDKGNNEEAKQLAQDLKENLEKINHHGKRAGDIVKGMLQHSRSSTGIREPTDINKLSDEYLRLSYHGLSAKDKEFNAMIPIAIGTDFDESIGNINIIPEDIGRVLLNLYNNAFYAVTEKAKLSALSYEPTVSVSTKRLTDKPDNYRVEIRVKDNGNGIPQKVVDKIFQPFFTTKPTGVGTGLGLSLSYDIMKAHGGEIKVETKEGEGSEFIVQIPIIS